MGAWVIVRDGAKVHVYYDNLLTGQRFPLGTTPPDVDDKVILDWIYDKGKPSYGDRIQLSDGTSLHYQPKAAFIN